MREIADRYVTLVLGVGQHDPDYVDAYYGDPALRPSEPVSVEGLLTETGALDWAIARQPIRSALDQQRATFLQRQLAAVQARLQMLQGVRFPFDEESRRIYDAVAPRRDVAYFASLQAGLESWLPGTGPLSARYEAYRRQFLVDPNRLPEVFHAALDECRQRTRARLTVPEGESFSVEYVTSQPWTAYNWYKGGLTSLIQVNTDLPMTVDRALHLAGHEGYPGHHVFNALFEDRLVGRRGCVEFTVYPLFSPQSVIAEGTADLGVELLFPGADRLRFEADVLYPIAGLDPATASRFAAVQAIVAQLQSAGVEAARRYLDGEIDCDGAVEWLTTWALMPRAQAEQRVRFVDRYRSYVITYIVGLERCRAWVQAQAGTADTGAQWKAFETLLTSPRTPGGLA